RICIILGNSISIICFLCILLIDMSGKAYAMMFLGIGVGYGFTIIACPSLINSWFQRNKALPMSVMLTSGAAGGTLMPVISEFLSEKSIDLCWIVFIGMALVTVLIAIFVIKDRPEDIGEVKDGREWLAKHPLVTETKPAGSGSSKPAKTGFTSMKEVFRSYKFYFIAAMQLSTRMVFMCFSSYIVLYSIQSGISSAMAAAILSMFSVSSLVGRILCGSIDKLRLPKGACNVLDLALMAAGYLILILTNSSAGYMTASIVTGFNTPFFPLLVSTCFGDAVFPQTYGIYNSVASFGSTVTPLIVAAIRNATGSYIPAFITFSAFAAIMAVLTAVIRPLNGTE
ncbi:MAG: MFS transporter, partial [Firmicutes bacterium]|nr:MFS transporter [Bacillota bacterium]